MKMLTLTLSILLPSIALADDYHVYKLRNGECEIDTRTPPKYKDQRGGTLVGGPYSSRIDAQNDRAKQVKSGSCKCPSGQNC